MERAEAGLHRRWIRTPEHGCYGRLAAVIAQTHRPNCPSCAGTLIPLDQPGRFAGIIREFARASAPA